MKQTVEKRDPSGAVDYVALGLTTFGVGYIPGPTGTYGSAVAVVIYLMAQGLITFVSAAYYSDRNGSYAFTQGFHAVVVTALAAFCLVGIWASGRTNSIFGRSDPSQAVVDEVMGQLITFCFIPFGLSWPFILGGFLLFRLFDIWKPFPVRTLEDLPGGLGICADDIVAGFYAGICLAVGYAVYVAI